MLHLLHLSDRRGCVRNCIHCCICSTHCGVSCTGYCVSYYIHTGICCIRHYVQSELVTAPIVALVWLGLDSPDILSDRDAFGLPIDVLFARISLLFPRTSFNCSTFPTAIVALVALAISPIEVLVTSHFAH